MHKCFKLLFIQFSKYNGGSEMRSEKSKQTARNYRKNQRATVKSQFNVEIKTEDFNKITNYCELNKISKPELLISMFNYCLSNNVNLAEWIGKEKQTGGAEQQTRSGEAEK